MRRLCRRIGRKEFKNEGFACSEKRYLKNYRRQTISHLTSRAQTESFLQPTEEVLARRSLSLCISAEFQALSVSPCHACFLQETETEAERVSLSFPVVVCVTRSDVSSEVGTKSSPQALEILHAFLRRECLKLGAALVFTSCKDSEKCAAVRLV